MPESGRKPPDFAERAERRARGAVLYLVLITTVLIVVCAAILWVVGVTSWPLLCGDARKSDVKYMRVTARAAAGAA